jgi:uncharacterized membrane protein YagU involved in acid resistance
MDIILGIGRSAGLVQLNLLGGLADLVSTGGVAYSTSGAILGFVIHLLAGVLWALLFAVIVRNLHSRHNLILGLINGLVVWLLWGLILPPLGITPQPWSLGTPNTIMTLIASLVYGLATGIATSEDLLAIT